MAKDTPGCGKTGAVNYCAPRPKNTELLLYEKTQREKGRSWCCETTNSPKRSQISYQLRHLKWEIWKRKLYLMENDVTAWNNLRTLWLIFHF